MPLVAKLGVCELALAALSGWTMVALVERPRLLRRIGVRHPARVRQAHLDLLFMGTILTAVGVAVNPMPAWVGVLLVLGAFAQPLMFAALAVQASLKANAVFRAVNAFVFAGTSTAWVALAVIALGR